jgi:hypothetical protein
MLKSRFKGSIILLIVVIMLLASGIVPVAASNNGGIDDPNVGTGGPEPITIDANWSSTSDSPPLFEWGAGEPVFSVSGPFYFSNFNPVTVDITDAFWAGDQFRIYDNGNPIGDTSSVPEAKPGVNDPNAAYLDSRYSHGSFRLTPGYHSISIEVIKNPYDAGGAYIRVMSTGEIWERMGVGGEVFPVNKTGLISPWIALAIVMATGGIYLARYKANK